MRFNEFENLMFSKGVSSLAEIARILDTTPQAVSNWKSRDQVPYHIVAKINNIIESKDPVIESSNLYNLQSQNHEDSIAISDILLTLAEQFKIILLIPFIFVFLTFTYVQFIQKPEYISWATVLVPETKSGGSSGISNIATQFGVNIPSGSSAKSDLSSPSLLPELLRSRTFAEKLLDKKFVTEKYGKELTLLSIITNNTEDPDNTDKEKLISKSLSSLGRIINYENDGLGSFSIITVKAFEPLLAKQLAEAVIVELESLNRFYKNQSVDEKILFIENRILSVKDDLEDSEQNLKKFNEENRQISSPSLKLQLERLTREMEVQKGIYLTLKQQLELAKIEEIQEASILQILDKPHLPLGPSNISIKFSVILAGILGIGFGIIIGFIRSYINNNDTGEKRKLRRAKSFIKKKSKDIILDKRIAGIISVLLLIGSPIYFGHESKNPTFFGLYSTKFMLVNILYIIFLFISIFLFIYLSKKENK